VVELAVVLVVVEDHQCRVEDVRVGVECLEDAVDVVGAVVRCAVRVLGERLVGNDPGHLRQCAGDDVGLDRGNEVVRVRAEAGQRLGHVRDAVVVQHIPGGRRAVLGRVELGEVLEVLEPVVAVVVSTLINAPAHTGLL